MQMSLWRKPRACALMRAAVAPSPAGSPWNCSPTHIHGRRRHRRVLARHLQGRFPRHGRHGAAADVAVRAAAIILPTAIAQDLLTLWVYRREWSPWNLKIMLPSMFVGMCIAWLLAASLSAAHIRLAIGLIAALFVLRHWLSKRFERYTPKPSVATGIIFGAIGGVTTMLANAGGPAWQIHLLPQKLEKLPYIGTLSILFAASNVVKVPGFLTLGYLTRDNLLVGLTLVPIALLANFLGIWMVRRVSTELFYRIAYVLMFVIAVELIRGSVV